MYGQRHFKTMSLEISSTPVLQYVNTSQLLATWTAYI